LFNKELEIYKVEKNNLLNKFKKKKQQDLENFLIDINPIIQEYMKNNSIDIVLDKKQIFIGNSKNDITQDILDLVNKTFKK
jgi:Skp family chaperone for outer membrane proteins